MFQWVLIGALIILSVTTLLTKTGWGLTLVRTKTFCSFCKSFHCLHRSYPPSA